MAILIKKNGQEIARMKDAGRIVADTHEVLAKSLKSGMTTYELDQLAKKFITKQGATPSFLNYHDTQDLYVYPLMKKWSMVFLVSVDLYKTVTSLVLISVLTIMGIMVMQQGLMWLVMVPKMQKIW